MNRPSSNANRLLGGLLILNSVLFTALYFFAAHFGFPIHIVYLALLIAFGLFYIIYNRGFVGRNATPEMLPDSMSAAEKQAYLESCRHRFSSSRWVLTILFPILLTFGIDLMYLFLFPFLKELFQ